MGYPFNLDQVHHGTIPYTPVNCTVLDKEIQGTCVWASVEVGGVGWLNATVTVEAGGQGLALTATLPSALRERARKKGLTVLASAYAWGDIPLMNAYDQGTWLPVLPWNRTLSASAFTTELVTF